MHLKAFDTRNGVGRRMESRMDARGRLLSRCDNGNANKRLETERAKKKLSSIFGEMQPLNSFSSPPLPLPTTHHNHTTTTPDLCQF